jgi:hypothetical protein
MNQQELQHKIAYYYSKLPGEAQEVFSSMKWVETLKGISSVYALSQEQQEMLGTETTLVLLGITHLDDYEQTIAKELKASNSTTKAILSEINNAILSPIRSDLYGAFEQNATTLPVEDSDQEFDNNLDTRFKELPANIQEAIEESNYQAMLYSIYKNYQLSIKQMGILENLLIGVILGTVAVDKFEGSLKNQLRLTFEEAKEITNVINEQILRKIRDKILKQDTPPAVELHQDETKVLNDAGIKIISDQTVKEPERKPDLNIPELVAPVRNALSSTDAGGGKAPTPSPLAQKFSNVVQAPIIKTEHTNPSTAPTQNIPEVKKSYPKGADPYRMTPE